MSKANWVQGFVVGLCFLFSVGCCGNRHVACGGGRAGCGSASDPLLGESSGCGVCGGKCQGLTPRGWVRNTLSCNGGCGEIYWGEWISDPPDCCDPCDNCGNYVPGEDCGRGRPFGGLLKALWGERYDGGCVTCSGRVGTTGCTSCAAGASSSCVSPGSTHLPAGEAPETWDDAVRIERTPPRTMTQPRVIETPAPARDAARAPALEPKAARPTSVRRTGYVRPGLRQAP